MKRRHTDNEALAELDVRETAFPDQVANGVDCAAEKAGCFRKGYGDLVG